MKASHKRFCHYYLKDFNASEAARKAGFSERWAADIGSRLLKRESIKVYISQSIEAAIGAEKSELKHRILEELKSEAFEGQSAFTVKDIEGNELYRTNPAKMKALELLAKYAKLLEDAPANTNVFINYPSEFKE